MSSSDAKAATTTLRFTVDSDSFGVSGQEGNESATNKMQCVCVCVCEHKLIPASSHVPLVASIPRLHSIQQIGCGLGYQPVQYGKTS